MLFSENDYDECVIVSKKSFLCFPLTRLLYEVLQKLPKVPCELVQNALDGGLW